VPSYIEESFLLFQKALYFIDQREELPGVALFQGKITKHLPSFCARMVQWDVTYGANTLTLLKDSASAKMRQNTPYHDVFVN